MTLGRLDMYFCELIVNNAKLGGAVYMSGGTLKMRDTAIRGNHAHQGGGEPCIWRLEPIKPQS